MNLNEIIVKLCRLKECDDIPLKYKADLQEIIHSLNYIHSAYVLGIDEEAAGRTEIDPIWEVLKSTKNFNAYTIADENADMGMRTQIEPIIEVSEDCISKAYLEQEIENQAMTVEKDKEYWRGWNNALDKVVELIEDAPSVVPTVRKNRTVEQSSMVGEWENYKYEHRCSECGEVVIGDWYDDEWYDYCPNCGAKMKGADDE